MELLDPTSIVRDAIPINVRTAVKDICVTHSIPDATQALIRMRDRVNRGRASCVSLSAARKNILKWYSDKVGLRELVTGAADRHLIKLYALAVFSINIVTAVAESNFSAVKSRRSKHRHSLPDEAAAIQIQMNQYPDVVGTTGSSTTEPLRLPRIDMNVCFQYDYSPHHRNSVVRDAASDSDDVESSLE